MDKNKFEQVYMEKSWSKSSKRTYRTFDIDKSVDNFSHFLEARKITGKLLDLGCGNGRNTVFFEKKGFSSLGVDFAGSAIRIAKKYAKQKRSKARFIADDILNLNLTEKYDVVIDCGCLHHIRKSYWLRYRSKLLTIIRENGYFYLHGISDCSKNKAFPKHPKKRRWMINNGHYTHFFSEKEVSDFLGKYFRIMKTYEFQSPGSLLWVRAFYMQRR